MRKTLLTLTALGASAFTGTATSYNIVGGVVVDDLGVAIEGVDVEMTLRTVDGKPIPSRHTTTDPLGRYTFSAVDAEGISLRASGVKFTSKSQTLTTRSNKDGVLVIDLIVHKSGR